MPKVALVTGCSTGVGLHTSLQLAQAGYKVYATMRDLAKAEALKAAAAKAGVQLDLLRLDVQDEASVTTAVAAIIAKEGHIDVLVNNAGFGFVRSLEQATADEFHQVLDVNFYGAARCIKAVLPHMRQAKSGHVLGVTSVGGLVGQPMNEIYCAAKFALEGLLESLATYLEPFFGVKVTIIEPAGIKSAFVQSAMTQLQATGGIRQDAYADVLQTYFKTAQERGSFEKSAQTSEQVAKVIVDAVTQPSAALRIQTSPAATDFCAEKLAEDPTGTRLQAKIRKLQLNLPS